MKKLLVGLLMLGAISSYATDFYDLETGKIIYQNDLQTRIQVAQREMYDQYCEAEKTDHEITERSFVDRVTRFLFQNTSDIELDLKIAQIEGEKSAEGFNNSEYHKKTITTGLLNNVVIIKDNGDVAAFNGEREKIEVKITDEIYNESNQLVAIEFEILSDY